MKSPEELKAAVKALLAELEQEVRGAQISKGGADDEETWNYRDGQESAFLIAIEITKQHLEAKP